jgi:hypothetical protein
LPGNRQRGRRRGPPPLGPAAPGGPCAREKSRACPG